LNFEIFLTLLSNCPIHAYDKEMLMRIRPEPAWAQLAVASMAHEDKDSSEQPDPGRSTGLKFKTIECIIGNRFYARMRLVILLLFSTLKEEYKSSRQ
jgi:hypothetical protein